MLPSSQAINAAYAASGLLTDAIRCTRATSPWVASPSRDTTATEATVGHESTNAHAASSDDMSVVVANKFSHAESEINALATVQTGVTHRLVAVIKIVIGEIISSTGALGDIVACEFYVDTARPRSLCSVRANKPSNFTNDVFKLASLATVWSSDCVSMHRVTCPHHWMSGFLNGTKQWTKSVFNLVCTHARDESESTWNAMRIYFFAEF
jgi:hypothetical protein